MIYDLITAFLVAFAAVTASELLNRIWETSSTTPNPLYFHNQLTDLMRYRRPGTRCAAARSCTVHGGDTCGERSVPCCRYGLMITIARYRFWEWRTLRLLLPTSLDKANVMTPARRNVRHNTRASDPMLAEIASSISVSASLLAGLSVLTESQQPAALAVKREAEEDWGR